MIPKFYDIYDDPTSPAIFTPWSGIHFLSGAYAYLLQRWIFPKINILIGYLIMLVFHTTYEFKDIYLSDGNSVANSIGDTIAATAGYFAIAPIVCKPVTFNTVFFGGLILLVFTRIAHEEN